MGSYKRGKPLDSELAQAVHQGRYGYEQTDDLDTQEPLYRENIYQSYDQTDDNPLNENNGKETYNVIGAEEPLESGTHEKHIEDKVMKPPTEDKLTKRIILELLVCILAFIGRGFCLNCIGPTLIDLQEIAQITVTQSASIFMSQSAGFLVGSLAAKPLLQRFNNELVMSLSLVSQALSSAFIPTFHNLGLMCLMFAGQGFAIGVVGIGVCATCIRLGGKTRNGMFLQAVYLGVSVGSVLGPFIANPFLSQLARHKEQHIDIEPDSLNMLIDKRVNSAWQSISNSTPDAAAIYSSPAEIAVNFTITTEDLDDLPNDETRIQYYYIIIAVILSLPAVCFLLLYVSRDQSLPERRHNDSNTSELSLRSCTVPLVLGVFLTFVQCLLYFGIQDTYSNLLTTFAVRGPLNLSKPKGVYLTSLFWASMCFGRLNGIWIAKYVSPFKMLLGDFIMGTLAATILAVYGGQYSLILWIFTSVLGLSFASVNGAAVSWAARHLPGNNYILSVIMIGRCVGLLIIPTAVTALLKASGAMVVMYAVLCTAVTMLITLLLAQSLVYNYGIDERLQPSDMRKQIPAEQDD